MASFTLNTNYLFASGDIGAYPASNWQGPPSGAPVGTATNTQTISGGSVTFTGLTAGARYYATDATGTKYVQFTVPSTSLSTTNIAALATGTQAAIDAQGAAVATEAITRAVQDQYLDPIGQYGGFLAPNQPLGTVAFTLTASRTYYCKFVATRSMNTTSIGFNLSTAAGSNDNVDVGIINATTLARVASSGATAGKLNGSLTKTTVPLVAALTAGTVYYAAISCGAIGSTAAAITGVQFTTANFTKLLGLTNPGCQAWYEASATVPSTATFGSVAATAPFLFVE